MQKKEVILINLVVKNFSMKRFEKYILDYPVLGKHKPPKLIHIQSQVYIMYEEPSHSLWARLKYFTLKIGTGNML